MLKNIFLIMQKQERNLPDSIPSDFSLILSSIQTIMAYPDESDEYNRPELLKEVITHLYDIIKNPTKIKDVDDDYLYANSKAIIHNQNNLLLVPLPPKYVLGLVFSLDDNPFDYRNELIRLLNEYFVNKFIGPDQQTNKNTLLLTLFIDLRKYADEFLILQEAQPSIAVINNTPMIKIFVYGIDNAGKSSLMRLLSTGKFSPDYFSVTKKFRITNIKLDSGVKLVCWDMPGQQVFRKDWLRGAQASNIMLFVLDCADQNRYAEAKNTLWKMLNMYELQGLPLVFLANKTDLVGFEENADEMVSFFDLDACNNRNWKLIFTSLPTSKGIEPLIKWLENQIEELLLVNGVVFPEKTS